MIYYISFLDKGRGVTVHEPLEIGDTEMPTADPIILSTETTGGKLPLRSRKCTRVSQDQVSIELALKQKNKVLRKMFYYSLF